MPRTTGESRVLATYQSSRGDGQYEIRAGADDVIYCTCTGWRMRRTCRHLTDWHDNGGRGAHSYTRVDGVNVVMPAGHGPINFVPSHGVRVTVTETATPLPTGTGDRLPVRTKYWNVLEAGRLVGKVTGTSKEAVLAMFIRTSSSGTITVKETR